MKVLIISILSMISTGIFSQSLTDSLILHYSFNGNANDNSANQFHGLTNGTYCPDPWGNPGQAIHFNGFDQYLNFPANQQKLKPELPISVAFWVNFEDLDYPKTFVFTTDFDQNNHSGLWMVVAPWGSLSINYGDATNNTSVYNRRTMWGSKMIEANTWYFVIGIARGPLDMDIYINCQQESRTYEGYGGNIGYTDCQGSLARKDRSTVDPPDYFIGSIDEFMYWNRALTGEDIEMLCASVGFSEKLDMTDAGAKIYPNPVLQNLSVVNPQSVVRYYRIINIMGVANEIEQYNESINVALLQPGSYILELLDIHKRVVQKASFIKM